MYGLPGGSFCQWKTEIGISATGGPTKRRSLAPSKASSSTGSSRKNQSNWKKPPKRDPKPQGQGKGFCQIVGRCRSPRQSFRLGKLCRQCQVVRLWGPEIGLCLVNWLDFKRYTSASTLHLPPVPRRPNAPRYAALDGVLRKTRRRVISRLSGVFGTLRALKPSATLFWHTVCYSACKSKQLSSWRGHLAPG